MKTCFKCRSVKPLSEFYKHKMMADGYLNKCKECAKNDTTNHRNENLERVREYDRQRSNQPHRVTARYEYQRTKAGLAAHNKANRKWSENNARKRAAQILFRNRSRFDTSLKSNPCIKCGAKAHGHHENYDKPLEVVWLCPLHHKARHKEMKNLGIEP